jgi:uncharacterized protein with HEPN domain
MRIKDRVLLSKILDEIKVIESVQQTTDENAFSIDKVRQHAVVMALLNAGELAKNLDVETRKLAPEIPWMRVIGLLFYLPVQENSLLYTSSQQRSARLAGWLLISSSG